MDNDKIKSMEGPNGVYVADELWMPFAGDFNAMTDAEVAAEVDEVQERINTDTEWLEAVQSWIQAGRPRNTAGDAK